MVFAAQAVLPRTGMAHRCAELRRFVYRLFRLPKSVRRMLYCAGAIETSREGEPPGKSGQRRLGWSLALGL
jgi:hypothetical protein